MYILTGILALLLLSNDDELVQVGGLICLVGSFVVYYLEEVKGS